MLANLQSKLAPTPIDPSDRTKGLTHLPSSSTIIKNQQRFDVLHPDSVDEVRGLDGIALNDLNAVVLGHYERSFLDYGRTVVRVSPEHGVIPGFPVYWFGRLRNGAGDNLKGPKDYEAVSLNDKNEFAIFAPTSGRLSSVFIYGPNRNKVVKGPCSEGGKLLNDGRMLCFDGFARTPRLLSGKQWLEFPIRNPGDDQPVIAHDVNQSGAVLLEEVEIDHQTNAYIWRNGQLTLSPRLNENLGPGLGRTYRAYYRPTSINNKSDVIGIREVYYSGSSGPNGVPFKPEPILWKKGRPTNIRSLLPPRYRKPNITPIKINDCGQLLGLAWKLNKKTYLKREVYSFLLQAGSTSVYRGELRCADSTPDVRGRKPSLPITWTLGSCLRRGGDTNYGETCSFEFPY